MQQPTKIRAILVAGAALVAAGAFATALGEETASGTAPTVSSGKMTLGECHRYHDHPSDSGSRPDRFSHP